MFIESDVDMITSVTTTSESADDVSDIKKTLLNNCLNKSDLMLNKLPQRPQFSISSPDRKRGLTSIIDTLHYNRKLEKSYKRGEFTFNLI